MTEKQKSMLKRLEFRTDVDPCSHFSRFGGVSGIDGGLPRWNLNDRRSKAFQSVRGIKKLYLHISRAFDSVNEDEGHMLRTSEQKFIGYRQKASDFGALRALNIDEAVVTADDSAVSRELLEDDTYLGEALTAAENTQLVKEIRDGFL